MNEPGNVIEDSVSTVAEDRSDQQKSNGQCGDRRSLMAGRHEKKRSIGS